ncbi:DUF4422 domain-containing protein [Selenomonas ruminantium]|uniref:DUF4422 domain-containing protein n=1 Tax=Selenomonas ruminantium TaxID=971 RepID=A0A1H0PPX3_SELRU|nr:DUF4422 domain-containing protein [Selenomonas ruminantium]SDP06626.1 protein of unknown function [Selenomonas ruminantium]
MSFNIQIMIVTHKDYWLPKDEVYYPMYVGEKARGLEKEGMVSETCLTDGTGDNIAEKNPNYCELTGMYWAWKNMQADYIGLVHYRRLFTCKEKYSQEGKREQILSYSDWKRILTNHAVVVPRKRRYYIESNYTHYIHAHHSEGLIETRKIIIDRYPEYLSDYDKIMNRTWAHMFNMFVMRKDVYNAYCNWLFSILFELESRIDISNYSKYEARIFGFISELLLDVWLEHNNIEYVEQNVSFMESQNWIKKGGNFIKRKFLKKV